MEKNQSYQLDITLFEENILLNKVIVGDKEIRKKGLSKIKPKQVSILPTGNLLLGRFTPQKYHGVVYGIKFILAFGSGPISVFLISEIYSITLEFTYLFLINAIMMAIVSIFIIFLPIQSNQKIATQD